MQDWIILKNFWERYCDPAYQENAATNYSWRRMVQALYANCIAHPVALKFVLEERPSLEVFREWLVRSNAEYQIVDQPDDDNQDESAYQLTAEQIAFWEENAYLVLPQVIDAQACAESRQAILNFLQADLNEPATWYSAQSQQQGLMLPLYNHPRLNTNRTCKRIRAAYEQLYGSKAIYKTIDHVSFNPPETNTFSFRGTGLHWDVSLALPIPERFQGLLYLSDCNESDGAFHCVPGFHHQIVKWLGDLQLGADARRVAADSLVPKAVPGNAGDFIIWHQALPHCATPNHGQTPRMVQYLSYIPMNDTEHDLWI